MANQQLKEALEVIWSLVYRATQVPYLSEDQITKLRDALRVISTRIDGDDYFNSRALYLNECVSITGILSTPSRKPEATEEILSVCQSLQHYLDRKSSKGSNS